MDLQCALTKQLISLLSAEKSLYGAIRHKNKNHTCQADHIIYAIHPSNELLVQFRYFITITIILCARHFVHIFLNH